MVRGAPFRRYEHSPSYSSQLRIYLADQATGETGEAARLRGRAGRRELLVRARVTQVTGTHVQIVQVTKALVTHVIVGFSYYCVKKM